MKTSKVILLFMVWFLMMCCDSTLLETDGMGQYDGVIPNDIGVISFTICQNNVGCDGCNSPGNEILIDIVSKPGCNMNECSNTYNYCLIEEAPFKHPKLINKEVVGRKYLLRGSKQVKVFFFYKI